MTFVKSVPAAEESVSAIMKRYPEQAIAITQLTEIVMRTGECRFTPEQRELIAAYASGINSCTYCCDTHRVTAEAFGIDAGILESLLQSLDNAPVDDDLKPVLRFVRKLTESPSRMVQSDADAVFDAGWDEDSFHFAVMICGLFNFYNRLIEGYGVENTAAFRSDRGRMLAEQGYGVVTKALEQ